MKHSQFDQLVRTFAGARTRRGLLAAASGALALALHPARANQLPATCAQTGQVCTLLYGCCSGLTCATSSINPSYGVCVPGEGGMVTSGTALVVPFDGTDTAQAQTVSDAVTDTSTTTDTTTTTTEDERQARIDARKAEVKSRRTTRKNEQDLRRDEQQDRRQDRKADADIANGPDLAFRVVLPSASNRAELIRLTNLDSSTIYVTGIESLLDPDANGVFQNLTIAPGNSHVFRSNDKFPTKENPDSAGETTWWESAICSELSVSDGFVLRAAFSSNGTITEYRILCDGTYSPNNANSSNASKNRKRRRNQQSRNRQQSRNQQKSRGKGK